MAVRRLGSVVWIALVLFFVGLFAAYARTHLFLASGSSAPSTVLLLGTDLRPGEAVSRSDVIMVVHLDPRAHRLELMSVPRDTMVQIPGHGTQKINAAFAFGGPAGAKAAVEQLLGVHIDGYVYTDFPGFVHIIDALGGVNYDVPQNMYYQASDVHIDLHAGYQHLDGQQVLELVRYRELPLGDIAREGDQQAILSALFHQAFSLGTVWRLPSIVAAVRQNVHTDLTLGQTLALAQEVRDCRRAFVTEVLPGAFLNLTGVSYWAVVPADARLAWQKLLAGVREPLFDPAAEHQAQLLSGQSRKNG